MPVARAKALPTVAKGNPLLGRIDRPTPDFFRGADTGEANRKSLLQREKVYFIPPGPDQGRHTAPPDPPACNGTYYYGACYYYGPASYAPTSDGGGYTTRIERPAFNGDGHTLNEISVQGGSGDGNIVELGWNVSTSQYSDADPHLFIFHWINWSGTCYDDCGWVQYSSTYFPGMNLAALVGRDVYNGYVYYQGNWWAWFDDQWLGYFPGSEWNGAYTKSTMIQWFGEVATNNGTPPNVEMGDGLFPTDTNAAPMVTLCDVDATAWVCWYRDLQSLGPNYPPYYDIRRTGFGATRYGGPGH
ncbi:MAG TPA: neprosin family prolyl endopeptidase [Thermoanaerobaculia bacterium]|nr:neprosin family prolyl endopeptidase [Thermoanaerobaculia bacterium]